MNRNLLIVLTIAAVPFWALAIFGAVKFFGG